MPNANDNPLGFKTVPEILEEQYKAKRLEDNVAPSQIPKLLAVMANLGFAVPTVTVGASTPDQNSLQLADYLNRGANLDVPVSVQLTWPGLNDWNVQAATLVDAFKKGIWQGFGAVASVLNPGLPTGELRELAFKQIPSLDEAFSKALMAVATKGLK